MMPDHLHDVSDGACDFCLQSPAVAPRIRSRTDGSTELLVRHAQERLTLWLRGERDEQSDHRAWAFAHLGESLFRDDE